MYNFFLEALALFPNVGIYPIKCLMLVNGVCNVCKKWSGNNLFNLG